MFNIVKKFRNLSVFLGLSMLALGCGVNEADESTLSQDKADKSKKSSDEDVVRTLNFGKSSVELLDADGTKTTNVIAGRMLKVTYDKDRLFALNSGCTKDIPNGGAARVAMTYRFLDTTQKDGEQNLYLADSGDYIAGINNSQFKAPEFVAIQVPVDNSGALGETLKHTDAIAIWFFCRDNTATAMAQAATEKTTEHSSKSGGSTTKYTTSDPTTDDCCRARQAMDGSGWTDKNGKCVENAPIAYTKDGCVVFDSNFGNNYTYKVVSE